MGVVAANDNAPVAGATGGLRFLSVCSGIEAASVAWEPLGWQAVAFSEIEKFPSAVLAHHYPDVPNLGDFTKIDTTTLGQVDILAGGTPCQAFSVAGLRGGLNDARGNLTLAFVELAHALSAGNGLRNVVWENVVGVLSDKTNAFGCFLAGLVGADDPIVPGEKPIDGKSSRYWKWSKKDKRHYPSWTRHGMVAGPKGRAAWAVKDAQFFGVAQRRRRVLVVADFGNGSDPAEILFEPESMLRHPPARGEARESATHPVAPSLVSSGRGVERTGDTRGQDPVVSVMHETGQGWWKQDEIAGTLRAEGENRPSRPSHVIAFSAKDYGADATEDLSPTLRAGGHTTSHANAGVMPAIAQSVAIRGREGGATAELGGPVATALRASQGGGDKPHVLTSAVRRLTPVECERLQGFPDNYTAIPWRNKPADQCPDGPRYKALGNSWAVPKFTWLGRRLQAALARRDSATLATKEAAHAA